MAATTTTPAVKPQDLPLGARHALAAQRQRQEDAAPKPPKRQRAATAKVTAATAKPSGGATAVARDAAKAATAAKRDAVRQRDTLIIERYVRLLAAGDVTDTVAKVGASFKPALTFGVCNTVLYLWKRDLKLAGKPIPGPRNVPAAVAAVKVLDRAAQPKPPRKPRTSKPAADATPEPAASTPDA
jgi:hypothetical protein